MANSFEQAVHWWKLAAEQGDADAQINLGDCFLNGEGVAKSFEHAVHWFKLAAKQGQAHAKFNLETRQTKGRHAIAKLETSHISRHANFQGITARHTQSGKTLYRHVSRMHLHIRDPKHQRK